MAETDERLVAEGHGHVDLILKVVLVLYCKAARCLFIINLYISY